VTLASMTSAYAAFAQGGIVRQPVFIRRVEGQEGEILFEGDPRPRRAVSESTAFLMSSMLADVIDAGTANSARRIGFKLPAAGKTGTTNDFVDAWFIGFTPRLVAGVWLGFDRPRTIVRNGFAGQLAVPMWARFMKAATRGDAEAWFQPPPDVIAVEVCRISGELPGAGCRNAASVSPIGEVTYKSMVYTDYFVRGREPQRTCLVHAVQYVPYPEPYFAETAFDTLPPLQGMERVVPEPVFAAVPPEHPANPTTPAATLPPPADGATPPPPVLPKHVIQVPAAPAPMPAPQNEPRENDPAPQLPPPAPAEAPPQGP
jgi:penicillin-binding protein 1A